MAETGMDRIQVASAVAESLFEAETAVETAIARAVGLKRQMRGAGPALGLSPPAGSLALARVAAAVDALTEARREVVRTHQELERVGRQLGLDTLGFGPLIKPAEGRMERLSLD